MNRLTLLIFAFLLTAGTAVHAQNISIDNNYYISSPVMLSGENTFRELETDKYCEGYSISFTVEKNSEEESAKNLETAAAIYQNGRLVWVSAKSIITDKPINRVTFDLPDFTADSSFGIKTFVWDNMMPLAESGGIPVTSEQNTQRERDLEKIRQRIESVSRLYSTSADPSSLLKKLNSDGKFSDIDYSKTTDKSTWSPSQVFTNVQLMCRAYFSPGNKYYADADLKSAIDSVLNDWVQNRYESVNWWFNEIDVPQKLSQILLYPFDENEEYLPVLKTLASKGLPKTDDSLPHKASDTGGNLIDKLLTSVKIAAATRDADSMENIVTRLLDNELSVFSHSNGGEGIMTDYSFHQHGSFFYDGSYGNVFCSGVNTLLGYLSDTVFAVSDRALNTYADYIIDGHSWFFKNSQSDFACFGRAISRRNGVGSSIKSDSLGAANILLEQSGITRRTELYGLKQRRLTSSDNTTTAAKHFYISDMTVVHRPGFYVSIRTSSSRNINTEYMNGENSKAMFISDGATVIMKSGNEYKSVFPVWDWSMIPGTTTEYYSSVPTLTSTYQYGLKEFTGGLSDGRNSVSAMDYARRKTTAKKSWFVFGNSMTALGAGITDTDSSKEVRTTMNQCIQNGETIYNDGSTKTLASGSVTANAAWVLHDGVGYIFPKGENVAITAQQRSGSWKSINSSQSSATETHNIFTLYTSHGKQPSGDTYEYTVLPSADLKTVENYYNAPDIKTISNTAEVQAVWNSEEQSAGIVFWNKGVSNYSEKVTFPKSVTGLADDLTIEALKDPCIVMLKKTDDGFDLIVSNPKNNSLANTYISVNRPLTGDNAVISGDKTIVTVDFPQRNERGKAVCIPLKLK